jgi:hypothetical protein
MSKLSTSLAIFFVAIFVFILSGTMQHSFALDDEGILSSISSSVSSVFSNNQDSSEANTEVSTEVSSEEGSETNTEANTEVSSEANTEVSSEEGSETNTEANTEASSEESSETNTEANTEEGSEETSQAVDEEVPEEIHDAVSEESNVFLVPTQQQVNTHLQNSAIETSNKTQRIKDVLADSMQETKLVHLVTEEEMQQEEMKRVGEVDIRACSDALCFDATTQTIIPYELTTKEEMDMLLGDITHVCSPSAIGVQCTNIQSGDMYLYNNADNSTTLIPSSL